MTTDSDRGKAAPERVVLYDTTMRDGTQGEGFTLSVPEKLSVSELLDDLGVAYLEGGWPGSNPRDVAFFEEAKQLNLRHAKLAAFGATRRAKLTCDTDPSIQCLLKAETPVVTVFGKSWKFQAIEALGITPEANLELVEDTMQYLRARVDEVIFDAEHFFDGYLDDPEYAMKVLEAAVRGGASYLALCDTNGGTLTHDVMRIVESVCGSIECAIGIHAHNDCELAVANSLAAVQVGASMVQGTVNGYGERCGNANLISIIPGLELKMGIPCLPEGRLPKLTGVSRMVDEITNHVPSGNQAFVGRSAFAHKGGVHVSAVTKDARTYEHIEPTKVGNRRRILISDLSGRANVLSKAREYGLEMDPDDPKTRAILERVKTLENRGYLFEGAEASFRLLVQEAMGQRHHYFHLHDMNVNILINGKNRSGAGSFAAFGTTGVQETAASDAFSVANLRIEIGGELSRTSAEGNGPVHAMDAALRKVVDRFYPTLSKVRLLDYRVRILSSGVGTTSVVRVVIQSGDGQEVWGTVGVSTDVIDASWQAMVDALEYKLVKDGVVPLTAETLGTRAGGHAG